VKQYNFSLLDREWGRMFVRVCPYVPFSARVCFNQHHWLANRLRTEEIAFRQCGNALLTCSDPSRLQLLADALTPRDLARCAQKWLRAFTPFFTPTERRHAACQHRLLLAQVEYCDNLIFQRRAALDALGERLFDANRTIGQPTTLATIFGRTVTKRHRGKLETIIEDLDLPNPVIRSYYRDGSIQQYVRDHLLLRTEATSNNVADFGVPKAIEACRSFAPPWRPSPTAISPSNRTSSRPSSIAANCASSPNRRGGRHLHHAGPPRPDRRRARHNDRPVPAGFAAIRPVEASREGPRRARSALTPLSAAPARLSICLLFLKLFERVYAPLTAGLLRPVTADARLAEDKRHRLDRLYQRIVTDLDPLLQAVGLRTAA
jgi:hypothetical protein